MNDNDEIKTINDEMKTMNDNDEMNIIFFNIN